VKFGLFYEHQLPRPWTEGAEQRLFHEALEQIELADRLGFDYAWEAEHHFLEEYSHSSAPEVFLAAASQRTRNIRLGHGVMLMPPNYNHPARAVERIATLDLVSNGRVDFGTGQSSSRVELEGFGISREQRHAMWLEAVEHAAHMMVMEPYPGHQGKYFSMPCRNVVPKPVQKPHPPLWMACTSRESIRTAARLGLGVLSFAFVDFAEARTWVEEYYSLISTECTPIGYSINPNIAMVSPFYCHEDETVARDRAIEGAQFFQFSLSYYYGFGHHAPGRSDLWEQFVEARPSLPKRQLGIGTPAQLREYLYGFADAGVDQVIFLQPVGRNRHDHICESLDLFARRVMPEFKDRERERQALKMRMLEPGLREATARRKPLAPLAGHEIPTVEPYSTQGAPVQSEALRWQLEFTKRIESSAQRAGG
jgi:alkanesulfonate monooxygenase SsuD/methylene tetrahydromethanopterin reductase-like flavin-dependent oxidoreductase (luciferase family)